MNGKNSTRNLISKDHKLKKESVYGQKIIG